MDRLQRKILLKPENLRPKAIIQMVKMASNRYESCDLFRFGSMFEIICITSALAFGLGIRSAGLPPLVGFLIAGFVLNVAMQTQLLPSLSQESLQHIAHLGVLMLLFTVGLKISLKQVLKTEVSGGAFIHFAISVLLYTPLTYWLFVKDWNTAFLLGVSLSFSSTVLAAKLLETKRELSSFHGRSSIGILIIQDLIALIVLTVWSGQSPNIYSLFLLGIPVYRRWLHKLVDHAGHGELMVLTSALLPVVIGGAGFMAMGLSPELGALVVGALLADHVKADEIAKSLLSLKELFLVCFFLSIGMSGLPTWESLGFAALFLALLPLKGVAFFAILVGFKLRARTAFLSAMSLMAYSEFGLIVAAALIPEFLVPLALTLSLSYVFSAPLNRYAHQIFERWETHFDRLQRNTIHPDEQPKDLGNAEFLIFGMGRIGSAAYQFLEAEGYRPMGLDSDTFVVDQHNKEGRRVEFADAEDVQFWKQVGLRHVKVVILALDDIEAKLIAAAMLRKVGFEGSVISHALHEDHVERIIAAGADQTYLTMGQAGVGLAENAILNTANQQEHQKVS